MGVSRKATGPLRYCPDWLRPYALSLLALAVASAVAVILLRTVGMKAAVLVSLLGDVVFLGSAWLGYGPGILVSILISFVVPRILTPGQPVNANWGRFALLLFVSALVSWVSASRRRSERLLRTWGEEMECRVHERTDALEKSEANYRLLFENNPQAMWVYDQQTLEFLTVNDTAVHRYGYTRDQFLRMTLKDIRPEEEVSKLLTVTNKPATELRSPGIFRHRRKNGELFWVEITEHPLAFNGRAASVVQATEVTERLRLEEHLRQSQRMESIGLLAGGVAHDFNNLLTVINGYAGMLLDDVPPGSPMREAIDEIQRAGERAGDLTKQLLAFSRRQVIQPTILNLNLVIADTQKMLRRLIGERIEIATKLAPDLGNLRADKGQLQQIIVNLAVNARDAMPNGGALVIETANVDVEDTMSPAHTEAGVGPYIVLTVTDTGTGMTPEVRQRLFEPFFTTKGVGAGTGLGLATVYGMVKQSGGWIAVYSEQGKGSTFRIFLPRTDAELSQPQSLVKGDPGSETILVVEDQSEVRTFAVAALQRYGYKVLSADGGQEALRIAKEYREPIHLLLTDIVMPGMTGLELAQQLPGLKPGMKVMFMSGYSETAAGRQNVLDPAAAYLQKPFTANLLAERVREVLVAREVTVTVLVVDDDADVRHFVRTVLTGARMAVVEACNGRQAVDLVSQGGFDLVITDLVMPEQEGIETIQHIRRSNPELKIIAMSGGLGSGVLHAAIRLGACRALAKPISRDELLQAVNEVLRLG